MRRLPIWGELPGAPSHRELGAEVPTSLPWGGNANLYSISFTIVRGGERKQALDRQNRADHLGFADLHLRGVRLL